MCLTTGYLQRPFRARGYWEGSGSYAALHHRLTSAGASGA
jgi:hypothetical protein